MDQRINEIMFSLLHSAICGEKLREDIRADITEEELSELFVLSSDHDMAHIVGSGLELNSLNSQNSELAGRFSKETFKAIFRYEHLRYDFENICAALEEEKIPFVPLKGSVIRRYYREPWFRTSCDIDILIHKEDIQRATDALLGRFEYSEWGKSTHDVSLALPSGLHLELHYDLLEEGRANLAGDLLKQVWQNLSVKEGCEYHMEMTDEFFYFYHIAHMAKHFEEGGCGIRPFIDLWILDSIASEKKESRDRLLSNANLLSFADNVRKLSRVWLEGEEADDISRKIEEYILCGGVYGSSENRVAVKQQKTGGRFGYLMSRIFVPFDKLKRYYPILEKHRWLAPVMQVRRWGMLLNPRVAKMAKAELAANKRADKSKSADTNDFLGDIGL